MKSLPSEVNVVKNKLEADTWFYRVDFQFSDGDTVYFCNDKAKFDYGGHVYEMIPFTLSPLKGSTGGELPTRTMSVAGQAISNFLTPFVRSKGGVRSAVVTITKVLYEQPALDMSATSEVYKAINVAVSDDTMSIKLGFVRLREQQIPLYQYTSVRCRVLSEFKGTLCGYAGADATCEGTPEDCISKSNYARFNAERGLTPGTLRLA